MMELGEARHREAFQPTEQEQMVKSLHAVSPRNKDRQNPRRMQVSKDHLSDTLLPAELHASQSPSSSKKCHKLGTEHSNLNLNVTFQSQAQRGHTSEPCPQFPLYWIMKGVRAGVLSQYMWSSLLHTNRSLAGILTTLLGS